MIYPVFLSALFTLYSHWMDTESTKIFNILHKGEVVGELRSTKITKDGLTTYWNTTAMELKIVTKVSVNFNIQATYKDNLLESAKAAISLNGKPYANTATQRIGQGYHFFKAGKLISNIKGDIHYSSARLIFDEPKGILHAYSEEKGDFNPIESTPESTYQKLNSRGRKTIYHYKENGLSQIELDIGPTLLEIVPR